MNVRIPVSSWALGLGLLLTGSWTAALAQDAAFRLEFHIDHDSQLLHSVSAGIRGTAEALANVQQVDYTFLPVAIDTRSWAAGEEIPKTVQSLVMTVTERGESKDGLAFARRQTLGWLPVQVVATVAFLREGVLESVRLGPLGLELTDPSLRVDFEPVYETNVMASETGLVRIPELTSIKLHFVGDLAGIAKVGVAIGRSGELRGVDPSFETWTVGQLREANGRLHLGSIANRRGVPAIALGDRRDFIWVVAVDAEGKAESYGTWRPQFLRETLDSSTAEAARAGEELHPFTRTSPRRE